MRRPPLAGAAAVDGRAHAELVDDLVTTALDAGAHQLVLLGAGYDTRGLRLTSAAASSVFEVDHPATQAHKRAALAPAAAHATTYVPVDFERDDLGAALAAG